MDSSDLRSTSTTGSTPCDIADNSSMMTPSKRDIFLSTYRRQNFTFPNSMMHYIAKNPKNTNIYQKMVESCKYFFIKNPILVLPNLHYDHDGWEYCLINDWKAIDINRIPTKLWITDELCVSQENVNDNSLTSSLIPKIYQCNFDRLILFYQIISLNEFMIICSSTKVLLLHQVTVKSNDGTVISFEKLIKQLPKLKKIYYTFFNPSNNTSKTAFKELLKIIHLLNFDSISLFNIPEDFNIDCFYSYMKKNNKTQIVLKFCDEISEEYKARLEGIVDEIIETENHEYKPPLIDYPGIDQFKLLKMSRLFII